MNKKLTKKQANEKIENFFSNLEDKKPEQIKKIKRLAMHYKIRLKDKRKLFCKYCYAVLKGRTIIRNKIKSVVCEKCGKVSRWKLKTS